MGIDRKAVFFSMSALLIVGLAFVTLTATVDKDTQDTQKVRVAKVIDDVETLERQVLPHLLRTSARTAINNITRRGPFTDEQALTAAFQECLHDQHCARGEQDSMDARIERLEYLLTEKLQYEKANVTFQTASFSQVGTWRLFATGKFHVALEDSAGFVAFDRDVTVRAPVSITGLYDPTAEEYLGTPRAISRHHFAQEEDWTTAELFEHARKGTYIADQEGPSYYMRLVSDYDNSTYGIRALAPPNTLSQQSYVDYEVARGTEYDCLFKVQSGEYLQETATLYLPERYAPQYNLFEQETLIDQVCITE